MLRPRVGIAAALVLSFAGSVLAQSDPDAAFVEWARPRAVPIDPAGKAFASLDEGISGARLIGIGESVHENQTFLTFRLELLQDLVRRHRVTALAIETGMPEAMALDEYVRGKATTVDYNAALPAGFGKLEDIRRSMEWLREWNLGAGKARPVSVYGADLPARSGSMVPALDKLAELTAGDAGVKSAIEAVRPSAVAATGAWWREAEQKYAALSPEVKASLTHDVGALVDRVQALSMENDETLAWARRLSQLIRQNEAVLRLGGFSPTAPRDVAMFENTMWVLERLGKEERAVYWAHNAHVQKVLVTGGPLPPGRFPSAGTRFATALGTRYFAIATAYGGPSMDKSTEPQKGSVDAALAAASKGSFLLTLGGPRPPAVEAWLATERPMRFQVDHIVLALGGGFDAVAFFDRAVKGTRVN